MALPRPQSGSLRVRMLQADHLGPAEIEAWRDLEDRALEPNAYLSPHFVLPALRHLDRETVGLVALVEAGKAGAVSSPRSLAGVAVFVHSGPTKVLPLPHLVAYASEHTFVGGLLLEADRAEGALEALFDFLGHTASCHGVIFHGMRVDGPVGEILRRNRRGLSLAVLDRQPRAAMVPKPGSATFLAQQTSSRIKTFRKRERRLAELGPVHWIAQRSAQSLGGCIERHLDLEHRGWKKEKGTSLSSSESGAAFFREVFLAFGREGRALFTELCVGDAVVASTSSLVSGRAAFAFKLGWEPSLATRSPSILNLIHLIRQGPEVLPDLDWFDSGSVPGSFMDELWLERCELARVVVPLTKAARIALRLVGGLRHVKRSAAAFGGR